MPYNPFGYNPGQNADAVNYFTYNAKKKAWLKQLDFMGFVNGDSSQLFELPGGPVRFAIGAEYREEDARYNDDDFAQTGLTNGVIPMGAVLCRRGIYDAYMDWAEASNSTIERP